MSFSKILLAVTLFATCSSQKGQAQPSPATGAQWGKVQPPPTPPETAVPQRIVRGVATTPNGKPLAKVTLYLLRLPGDSIEFGEAGKIVTDARGRFTWAIPPSVSGGDLTDVSSLESSAPSCYALAQDPGWTVRVALARESDPQRGVRDLMEKAALPCKTRWLATGLNPPLSVVVPDRGRVRLLVRSPNGLPLRKHRVQLVSPEEFSNYLGAVVYEGQTDGAGVLEWPGFSGRGRLLVWVPGVGFGSTGAFDILPDQVVAPQVPPLAAFARVSGKVDPRLAGAGAAVRADASIMEPQEHRWLAPQGTVDAQGHFVIEDLLPGNYALTLAQDAPKAQQDAPKAQRVTVKVRPGENKTGISIEQAPPPEPVPAGDDATKRPQQLRWSRQDEGKSSVTGRVTDAAGNPVAGADVYAISTYSDVMRQNQEVHAVQTQADGSYSFAGLRGTRVSLVAAQAGRPLAFDVGQGETPTAPRAASDEVQNLRADLVFPTGHPQLTVRVLNEGKPRAGVFVRLTPQVGVGLFSSAYLFSDAGAVHNKIEDLMAPTSTTNAEGEATFSDLTLGLWDISATSGDKGALDTVQRWFSQWPDKNDSNFVPNVAVQKDTSRRVTINLVPRPEGVALWLLSENGTPPASPNAGVGYGSAMAPYLGGSSEFKVDKTGTGLYRFERSGLWRVHSYFRDLPVESIPATAEPFYEGDTFLAVSPALPRTAPVVMRSIRRDRGHIRVQLQDDQGRPCPGSVWIGDFRDTARYAASFRPGVGAVFSDMPSGTYTVRASLNTSLPLPDLGGGGAAFPSDAALTGVRRIVVQSATVKPGQETRLSFRPQLQGYIRGKVVAPAGTKCYVSAGYDEDNRNSRYDPQTGEFVAGPFAPGKINLFVERTSPSEEGKRNQGEHFSVSVVAGKVVHVTLSPKFAFPPATPDQTDTIITMGGVFNLNRGSSPATTVLLADGVTPAWGAMVALFSPQIWQPTRWARADALGHLSPVERWFNSDAPTNPPSGSPSEPVLVVWLPGSNGAVIVPSPTKVGAPIILPQPVSIRGRITVGGQPVKDFRSSFHVLAAYQGRGKLNSILSVQAIVEPDGTFELSGLTPGSFQIQAERDGIWVSSTRELAVGGPLPGELLFDIPEPGALTMVHLINKYGQPLRNQLVAIGRPPGPLTKVLWPRTLSTDAAGDLRLEGWEAGIHRFQLATQKASSTKADSTKLTTAAFSVTVAPFTQGAATEVKTIAVH